LTRREAEIAEVFDGFAAEELAADFVMRLALFFQQEDATAGSGEAQSCCGTGGSATDDEVIG